MPTSPSGHRPSLFASVLLGSKRCEHIKGHRPILALNSGLFTWEPAPLNDGPLVHQVTQVLWILVIIVLRPELQSSASLHFLGVNAFNGVCFIYFP